MENKLILPVVVAVVVIAIVGFLVYMQSGLRQGTTVVKIGHLDLATAALPIYVALENGYFEDEQIEPELIKFQSSNLLSEALANNQIDLAIGPSTSVLYTIEQRDPGKFRIFMTGVLSTDRPFSSIIVTKDSQINEIMDLEGKKIAVLPGSTSLVFTRLMFKNMGYENLNVTPVQMPPNLWAGALSSGQVDSILAYEPFGTLILHQGDSRVLSSAVLERFILNDIPAGGNSFSTKFAEENPETAAKIVRVFKKSSEFIEANIAEARKIMAEYSNLPESVAQEVGIPILYIGEDIDVDKLQEYADVLLQEGELEKQIDVAKLLYIIPQKVS